MLTERQREVLTIMRDENEELVYEDGMGFVGDTLTVAPRTVFALLRLCAIRLDPHSEVGSFERYTINETGRNLLVSEAKPQEGK